MASPKQCDEDSSTFLEQEKAQEPSHAPTPTEDFDDNRAPPLIPPSADVIIIRDENHDLPDDVYSDPKNGVPLQLTPTLDGKEYSLEELFDEKEDLSGNSLGSEMSIFDPLTQQPVPLQASNITGLEDPVLSTDSIDDSKLGGDNSSPINLEDFDWILFGLEQLAVDDVAIGALIREHKIVAHHKTQDMTNFQKVIRSLLELLSIPERKSTIYKDLVQLCHPDIVRPHSVTTTSHQDLIRIGVSSRSNAITISEMGKKFAEAAGDNRKALLSDASLNDMPDEEIYNHLQGVCGLGAYNAYTIMIFGLEKMLDHWPNEVEFRLKYNKFNEQLRRWPWSNEVEFRLKYYYIIFKKLEKNRCVKPVGH